MNRYAVSSASKQFLRTREGVHAAPSIRGLIRHLEATTALYEAFVASGANSRNARLAFGVWRLMLIAVSETVSLLQNATRLWRF
jgi:hypothetical protein